MISNPCASSSSVMHSGGLVWIELLASIVYRPFSRRYLPIAFISSDVPLNGVSGVHGSRVRTRSMIPNSPRLRSRRPTVSGREPFVVAAHDRAHPRGVVDEAVLLVDPDRRERRGERHRVRRVRQAAVEHLLLERLRDVGRIATAPSGRYDEVSPLAIVIRSGTTPQWSTANQRPVRPNPAITSSATIRIPFRSQISRTPCEVAVGRDEDAVRADDRLEEDGRDRLRPFVADDVLEALQALLDRSRLRLPPAMRVRIADDADEARLVRPATRVAGQRHRPIVAPW